MDYERNQFENAIITMTNNIARGKSTMNVRELKLFLSALSLVRTRDKNCWIQLNKAELMRKLEIDPRDSTKLEDLYNEVKTKSRITYRNYEQSESETGDIIRKVRQTKHHLYIRFDEDYIPLLDELDKHFTWFYLDNIACFKSKHAITLFKYLRSWYSDVRPTTTKYIPLDELRFDVFGLSPDAYMVKRRTKDKTSTSMIFDIYTFEKKVLNKAIMEINEEKNGSGMRVEVKKEKSKGGTVQGYNFEFLLINKSGVNKFDISEEKRERNYL